MRAPSVTPAYLAAPWGTSHDGQEPHWTDGTRAWLAAVLDCEGSISVRGFATASGTRSFVPWVRVGMMDPEVCEHAYLITGVGQTFRDKRGVYNWGAASQQCRYVLENIWTDLLIKRRQALGAIELARHIGARKARGTWSSLTAEDLAYREMIREAVQAWNRREVVEWEPPVPAFTP